MTSATWESSLASLRAEWLALGVDPNPVPGWEVRLAGMDRKVRQLREAGQWRSGGRTLMHALGLHHDEVILCRGLAWLLTPDAWHGLGASVLRGLLVQLDAPTAGIEHATIVTEEARGDSRADIIVRYEGATILIEAKVWAAEQPRQGDRLATWWEDESPRLVFLTRHGKAPVTAVESADFWHPISWHDIANVVESVLVGRTEHAPGVLDLLTTLRLYGGKPNDR